MEFKFEKKFQDAIFQNSQIQQRICECLSIDFYQSKFIREDRYINGIIADFTIFENNIVKAIMECKGADINVTDFVRGIGQIFQYEFFAENKLSRQNYNFCNLDEFSSVYIFPDTVLRLNDFNIGLFKYPKSKKIIEVNSKNLAVRLIGDKELETLKNSKIQNLTIISQYYIRDNRIFELYFLLKVLLVLKLKSIRVVRRDIENNILRKSNSINNNNWRNAFISLASLGFIDSENYPTSIGVNFANMDFSDFAYMIYEAYIKPYFEIIFPILEMDSNLSIQEIISKIFEKYDYKNDILFLTQSNGRYLSSWLNIIRDDFGLIQFNSRDKNRKILLNPLNSNKEKLIEHIKNNTKYTEYKSSFERIINEL